MAKEKYFYKKYFYIVEYQGDAEYEPAEGGYYVPVTEVSTVSTKRYKEKHARRELKKAIKEASEYYGEPTYVGKYVAIWSTGKYVGDTFEIRMTGCPALHEQHYYGYC